MSEETYITEKFRPLMVDDILYLHYQTEQKSIFIRADFKNKFCTTLHFKSDGKVKKCISHIKWESFTQNYIHLLTYHGLNNRKNSQYNVMKQKIAWTMKVTTKNQYNQAFDRVKQYEIEYLLHGKDPNKLFSPFNLQKL
jgi:hypothetical protein